MGKHHVILTGPYRSGKGLMVEILTNLGMDTGFTVSEAKERKLFLEFKLWGRYVEPDTLPYILKHPKLCTSLVDRVDRYNWNIDHVYIFLREPEECAKSLKELRPETNLKSNKRTTITLMGELLYQIGERNFPHTFIKFPLYAEDWSYFREATRDLIKDIPEEKIKDAWKETVDPTKVKDYE